MFWSWAMISAIFSSIFSSICWAVAFGPSSSEISLRIYSSASLLICGGNLRSFEEMKFAKLENVWAVIFE